MKSRAVFLDRDGVINRAIIRDGKPYPPSDLKELEILPRIRESLDIIRGFDFKIIVVTNQPDVGRGKSTKEVVDQINNFLFLSLPIDEIRCCFHGTDDECNCRKPKPGMLIDAAKKWNIDLRNSFMVGDRWRDIDAGLAAGCRTIWIKENYQEQLPSRSPDHVCRTLYEAANWISQQEQNNVIRKS